MVYVRRKGWQQGGEGYLQIKIFYSFVNKKTKRKHWKFCLSRSVATLIVQDIEYAGIYKIS